MASGFYINLLCSVLLTSLLSCTQAAPEEPPVPPVDPSAVTVTVKGTSVDVRTWGDDSERELYVFPRCYPNPANNSVSVSKLSVADLNLLKGLRYATTFRTCVGLDSFSADGPVTVTMAWTYSSVPSGGLWTDTGKSVTINKVKYFLFTYDYSAEQAAREESVKIPSTKTESTLLFAPGQIFVDAAPGPVGTVARAADLRKGEQINDPQIIKLSDGSLLASLNDASSKNSYYHSTDGGQSWEEYSTSAMVRYGQIYTDANDCLYMIGSHKTNGSIVAIKSTDQGKTWSDKSVLFQNGNTGKVPGYHGGSTTYVESGGRVWRAIGESYGGTVSGGRGIGVISAPIGSDLMKASSWTMSNIVYFDTAWVPETEDTSTSVQEPTIVECFDGSLKIVARIDGSKTTEWGVIFSVASPTKIAYEQTISMPGGTKKFTIKKDSQSGKYYSLVSPVTKEYLSKYGISPTQCRNFMALVSSTDLVNWTQERMCVKSANPYTNSYHYIDWVFDGNDILAVFRCSVDERRGMPFNQHDSNTMGFFKVKNFRTPDAEKTVEAVALDPKS